MPSRTHIVSFDDARRVASGSRGAQGATRASRASGSARIVVPGGAGGAQDRPKPSWYTSPVAGLSEAPSSNDSIFLSSEPAPRAGRFADADDDSYDADLEQQLEEALEKKRGPLGSLRSKAAQSRHDRVKERAGKAYFRQYEAGRTSDAAQSGPRAAVYKGEMGASHKRSARMQNTPSPSRGAMVSGAHGVSARRLPSVGGVFGALGAVAAALALTVAFLYGPAQQLYVDLRERDRLAAEYDLVVARNDAISRQVEALQTEEGIEDVARVELGWVREGEHAVSVSNLDLPEESDFQSNIVSEDVPMPETWYSGVLDPLFGVE